MDIIGKFYGSSYEALTIRFAVNPYIWIIPYFPLKIFAYIYRNKPWAYII